MEAILLECCALDAVTPATSGDEEDEKREGQQEEGNQKQEDHGGGQGTKRVVFCSQEADEREEEDGSAEEGDGCMKEAGKTVMVAAEGEPYGQNEDRNGEEKCEEIDNGDDEEGVGVSLQARHGYGGKN